MHPVGIPHLVGRQMIIPPYDPHGRIHTRINANGQGDRPERQLRGGKVNIVIRGASILTGGTALVFAAAACGGGAPSTTSGGGPSTRSGTPAPPQAPRPAPHAPAAARQAPL